MKFNKPNMCINNALCLVPFAVYLNSLLYESGLQVKAGSAQQINHVVDNHLIFIKQIKADWKTYITL